MGIREVISIPYFSDADVMTIKCKSCSAWTQGSEENTVGKKTQMMTSANRQGSAHWLADSEHAMAAL